MAELTDYGACHRLRPVSDALLRGTEIGPFTNRAGSEGALHDSFNAVAADDHLDG
jgi:hypothetical protein